MAKTATPLRSWDEVHLDTAPIPRWGRDRHGFQCWIGCCEEHFWQVLPVGGSDRMCKSCARSIEGLAPEEVWAPKLPAAHGHIACPGLMPEEPYENKVGIRFNDGTERWYGMGDANPFLGPDGWMGLTVNDDRRVSGTADAPHIEITGSATAEGHRFSFLATFEYDAGPQGWRRSPYGFRFTAGALASPDGSTHAFTDVFELVDTIARGEAAFMSGSTE